MSQMRMDQSTNKKNEKRSNNKIWQLCGVVIFAWLWFWLAIAPIQAESVVISEKREKDIITKGLEYEHREIFTNQGWINIHVLMMDMSEENVGIDMLRSNQSFGQRETMLDFAKDDNRIVAGINGSFFNMSVNHSDPLGIFYEEGYLFANQYYNTQGNGVASMIERKDKTILFDFVDTTIRLANSNGITLYIDGINKIARTEHAIIYNSEYAKTTAAMDAAGEYYKIVIQNNQVVAIVDPKTPADIPDQSIGYVVLVPKKIGETHLKYFPVQMMTELQISSRVDATSVKSMISGGGKIIEDGKIVAKGHIVDGGRRHPRTAIGITKDGKKLISMVIDGRNNNIGATHNELGYYLLEYGVNQAIHMDGGGSSTLIGRRVGHQTVEVLNQLSGGGQRKILNGIGFLSLKQGTTVSSIKIVPSSSTVFKNNKIDFSVLAYDEYDNPIAIDNSKLVWNIEGLTGNWETNRFVPTSVGEGVVTCFYNNLSAKISIRSIDKPIKLTVEPKILQLGLDGKGGFNIKGLDISGYQGSINPQDVSYKLENDQIGRFGNGVFVASGIAGISKVRIELDGTWTTAYVAVGSTEQVVPEFETTDFSTKVYPATVTGQVKVDHSLYYDTSQSYQLSYGFAPTPDPQSVYMLFNNCKINQKTDYLGLSVLGNGSGHMINGVLTDAKGRTETVTFSDGIDFNNWKTVTATLPADLVFPIKLEQIYVVAYGSQTAFRGTLNIDRLTVSNKREVGDLPFDKEGFINDPLMAKSKPKEGKPVKVFGPTVYRNRLLDNILLEKVYAKMTDSDYSIFAGLTDVNKERLGKRHSIWENKYKEYTVNKIKFIQLGTGEGGIRKTDYTQYAKLKNSLKSTTEDTIVIIANKSPLKNFEDKAEGQYLHELIANYKNKSGKEIFFVYGGGYNTDVSIRDGVRYIDLSGLWYKVSNRRIDLNQMFYTLNFYRINGKISYLFEPLYPVVEVN